ncbi:hypothetical protein F5Y17DRAFT_120222 [Xylariaceae sp. FL0594]|nr:hypothetical protein F5Y17DRAFT_120222 [Xylariaceae sp. FL0594]
MLRRLPTTLTLTQDDITAYEDRKHAAAAQAQGRAQSQHQALVLSPQSSPLETSPVPSSNNSMDEMMEDAAPATDTGCDDDDDQEEEEGDDADDSSGGDDDDDDDDDDDPFTTRRLQRTAMVSGREVSPGAQRGAYVQQMRARGGPAAGPGHARSQSQARSATSIPTSTSVYTSASTARTQRIMGTASPAAGPAPGPTSQMPAHLQQTPVQNPPPQSGMPITRAAAAGRTGRQTSEPPLAPSRLTRSRDERIAAAGLARPADGGGGTARRR